MALYGFAVFSGAFLLFLLQPLVGKYILPWFGGAPAVWTTCLMVFQFLLLGGYSYAYFSSRLLKPRVQVMVHLLLLVAAVAMLPITPDISWKPLVPDHPTLRICEMLTVSLGLPFLILAASAPLLQHWFTLVDSEKSPFRLYAFSNAGSLVALLSYPILFETWFTRGTQAIIWSAGLGVYGLSCAWAGIRVWRAPLQSPPALRVERVRESTFGSRVLWVLFPSCASLLLLAVTNRICQDLAPVPLLWVLPLSIYLTSFIFCFNDFGWYDRRWFGPALIVSLAAMALTLTGALSFSAPEQVLVFCAGLFICCTVCHGELYRLRPNPARLTTFYLAISAGGAFGGTFVAVIAPRLFSDYFELHAALILCGTLFLLGCWREQRSRLRHNWFRIACAGGAVALVGLALDLGASARRNNALRVHRSRNFYGVLNVYRHETADRSTSLMELVHGRVAHGVQFLQSNRAQTPTLYYTTNSGVGRAFEIVRHENRKVGVIGLGAGTLAAYMHSGDQIRFYEINPAVERIAKTFFTFLEACPVQVQVVLGDGRLSLEQENRQDFDLLVLDAFNSDSIPIHLLTREAFAVYQRHMKTNGVIALNVSNMSLNLEPVIFNVAREFGYSAVQIRQPAINEMEGMLPSTWVLLSRDSGLLNAPALVASDRSSLQPPSGKGVFWTDDFNGLFAVLRWHQPPAAAAAPKADSYEARTATKRANLSLVIERFRQAVERDPNSSVALNNLACLLATAPDPALRNGPEAVKLAERACGLTQYQNTSAVSTLAAAYAEAGRFEEAVTTAERACAMASEKGEQELLAGNQQMLDYFKRKQAYHQASQ